MKLKINNDRKIKEIQEDFNNFFPFLKLAFFDHGHKRGEMNNVSDMLDNNLGISEIRFTNNEGEVKIKPNMRVSELELALSEMFDLHVQVQRKSGDIWLVTTASDSWTLKEQNEEGSRSETTS